MAMKDPRNYVSVKPLPVDSQKGVRIQARSIEVYNPTEPTRDEIRKQNFTRRWAQISGQGFRSANHKPYQGIGDPFYLEEKKLILHALGQWDESQEWETSSSSEADDSADDFSSAQRKHMTAVKFVLRRTRKDLNTLNKEVSKGRQMIRNVRLGHGLFDLIRQERVAKKTAAQMEKQKKTEAARNAWQPPKRDSDSEESDEEMSQDDEQVSSGVNVSNNSAENVPAKKKKKKAQLPRPFTPQHNSLVMEDLEENSEHALFRQLCAVNWILDAMNLESSYTMSSIMTCWNHNEIGGSKIFGRKPQECKQADLQWERFVSNSMPAKVWKKVSTTRGGRYPRQSVRLFNPRTSFQSVSPSPSSSSSAINIAALPSTTLSLAGGPHREDMIPEERTSSTVTVPESEDDSAYSKSMFKFLDEYYDSLRRELEKKKAEETNQDGENTTNCASSGQMKDKSQDLEKRTKKSRQKSKEREKTPDRQQALPKPVQYELQEALGIPRGMRADKFIKPKPSAELMEFHEQKASNKYLNLSLDLANKFKEVQDDKAMTLHDVLEHMERQRLLKCQSKYMSMNTRISSVYRALEIMRREGKHRLKKPSAEGAMRRKSSFRGNWYMDLHQSIPSELKNLWYYQVILNKLRKYGMTENTSKQSVYKFLKVLGGLRDWEICSPDISAAIEFCRERIMDLSVEDYEEWFKSIFPRITRPQTAPPALRGGQEKKGGTSASSSVEKGRPGVRLVQSAFGQRTQR